MTAEFLELLEKIKSRFVVIASNPIREKIPNRNIVQYNVTVNGKVTHTVVLNLKDFVLNEVPNANNDLEITLSDNDVINLWQDKSTLVDLKAAVSVSL